MLFFCPWPFFDNYFFYSKGEKIMIYIYDLLLNFQDSDRLVEFFEWSLHDSLDHVKRIPIVRIPSVDMDHFCFSDILVETNFLNKIKGRTLLYKKKKTIFYSCLFCDLNRVVAVEFSSKGKVIARSCLLLDEEEEVIDSTRGLEEERISYKVLKKNNRCSFLTREEEFQRKYLQQEMNSLFKSKNVDKLSYLYEEVFGKDNLSFVSRYDRLMDDLTNHFDCRYRKLFKIVRLSYSKK